jgi:hypothetical protein
VRENGSHIKARLTTETNRTQFVLFDMQNRIFGSFLVIGMQQGRPIRKGCRRYSPNLPLWFLESFCPSALTSQFACALNQFTHPDADAADGDAAPVVDSKNEALNACERFSSAGLTGASSNALLTTESCSLGFDWKGNPTCALRQALAIHNSRSRRCFFKRSRDAATRPPSSHCMVLGRGACNHAGLVILASGQIQCTRLSRPSRRGEHPGGFTCASKRS